MPIGSVKDLSGKKVKKRMGRPPLVPGKRRSAKLNISLFAGEAKRFLALASREGKSFSTWAREVLVAAVDQLERR